MSTLEKLLYVADCVEPFRSPYPGLDKIRHACYRDLDDAFEVALRETIQYQTSKGAFLHPHSLEALESLSHDERF
jgi:HD superfamily phosphohydrolase YqeK